MKYLLTMTTGLVLLLCPLSFSQQKVVRSSFCKDNQVWIYLDNKQWITIRRCQRRSAGSYWSKTTWNPICVALNAEQLKAVNGTTKKKWKKITIKLCPADLRVYKRGQRRFIMRSLKPFTTANPSDPGCPKAS